jgi:hypothetical protein
MWQSLVEHAKDFGFLGPIVGIVGLLLGAGTAILFGWSRALNTWKPPPETFPKGMERVVGLLCAVGLFVVWIRAEPKNGAAYLNASIWFAVGTLVTFLIYIGFWKYLPCQKPRVGVDNKPTRDDVVWGGFWLWKEVRREVGPNNSVCKILGGKLYDPSQVWPPLSLALSAVVTAAVLIAILVCGTLALCTAGASIQVALTNKPARSVFSIAQVPGLSSPTPTPTPTPAQSSPS